jgi:hypothetical protein
MKIYFKFEKKFKMDSSTALNIIKDDILIKFHENNWEQNHSIQYNFCSYMFSNNFEVNIQSQIFSTKIIIHILTLDQSYSTIILLYHHLPINDRDDISSQIENFVKLIYTLNQHYQYSKVLDRIILKTEKVKQEELYTASRLIKHKPIETCCVCTDLNIVLTKCGHNLCRECFLQMKKVNNVNCPLCREILVDEYYDDEEDAIRNV